MSTRRTKETTVSLFRHEPVYYNTIHSVYNHDFRMQPVHNADPSRIGLNEVLENEYGVLQNGRTLWDAWRDRYESLPYQNLPASDSPRGRKSNIAIEVVMSLPSDYSEDLDIDEWKRCNMNWLHKTYDCRPDIYGTNVLAAVYHGDESAPHIHALIQPVNGCGEIQAHEWLQMYATEKYGPICTVGLQDDYRDNVIKKLGLMPSMKRSVAKHREIKDYYRERDAAVRSVPEPRENELAVDYLARERAVIEKRALDSYALQLERERMADVTITKRRQRADAELEKIREEAAARRREMSDSIAKMKAQLAELEAEMHTARTRLETDRDKLAWAATQPGGCIHKALSATDPLLAERAASIGSEQLLELERGLSSAAPVR